MNEREHVDNFLEHYGTSIAPDGDYLQHWKYIKRERKKGKWVYTYPYDKAGKTGGIKDAAKNAVDKVKDKLGFDEKAKVAETKKALTTAASERAKDQKKAAAAANKAAKDGIVTVQEEKNIDRASVSYNISNKKAADAAKQYAEAKEAYSKTTVAKVENAVNKGKNIMDKVLDTIANPVQNMIAQRKDEKRAKEEAKRTEELAPYVKELEDQISNFERNGNPIPKLDIKKEATTRDEDMAIINPDYSRDPENVYNENCAYCTLAYDLRRRGYDVEAGSEIDENQDGYGDGMTPLEILECYENSSADDFKEVTYFAKKYGAKYTVWDMTQAMEKDMLSQGEGARGHLCLYWAQGGGHDVIWEVENGNVVVRDCQTNTKLDLIDYTQYCSSFGYIRTDNLTPNEKCLDYVRNREDDDK